MSTSELTTAFQISDTIADYLKSESNAMEAEYRAFLKDVPSDLATRRTQEMARARLPEIRQFLDAHYSRLTAADESLPAGARESSARYHRHLVQPYFLGSRFVRWSIDKPMGYPGDFRIVEMLFDNKPGGESPFSQALATYTLDCGPTRAHRARMPWTHSHLRQLQQRQGAQPLEILSYACGPERILREYVAQGGEGRITLCDFDLRALEYAKGKLDRAAAGRPDATIRTVHGSALDLADASASLHKLRSTREDGLYDAVLVLGLLDYLNDAECGAFLKSLLTTLRPGGLVLLSNLHTVNPWRSFMEYVGAWQTIHRSAAHFGEIALGTGRLEQLELTTDETGTNVFFAGVGK